MANTMRWRYGDTSPVVLPVDSDVEIEIGDLVYLDIDDAKCASGQADQGSLDSNQELFHDNFVGVAMQSSPTGSADSIRIATSGVFEFDCPLSTFEVGGLVGVNENTGGTELEDQNLIAVATPNLAIGRCAKRLATSGNRVLVDIVSTVLRGGPQAAA